MKLGKPSHSRPIQPLCNPIELFLSPSPSTIDFQLTLHHSTLVHTYLLNSAQSVNAQVVPECAVYWRNGMQQIVVHLVQLCALCIIQCVPSVAELALLYIVEIAIPSCRPSCNLKITVSGSIGSALIYRDKNLFLGL